MDSRREFQGNLSGGFGAQTISWKCNFARITTQNALVPFRTTQEVKWENTVSSCSPVWQEFAPVHIAEFLEVQSVRFWWGSWHSVFVYNLSQSCKAIAYVIIVSMACWISYSLKWKVMWIRRGTTLENCVDVFKSGAKRLHASILHHCFCNRTRIVRCLFYFTCFNWQVERP